jgi:hypothetical protein
LQSKIQHAHNFYNEQMKLVKQIASIIEEQLFERFQQID